MPLIFALFSYFGFIVAGIRAQGGWNFFKGQLFPPGIPWPIYFIMTPIEFLSTFILRPIGPHFASVDEPGGGAISSWRSVLLERTIRTSRFRAWLEALRGLSRSSAGSPSCASKSSLPDCRHTSSLC